MNIATMSSLGPVIYLVELCSYTFTLAKMDTV